MLVTSLNISDLALSRPYEGRRSRVFAHRAMAMTVTLFLQIRSSELLASLEHSLHAQ